MKKLKKIATFAVAMTIAFAFTFCDNQLEPVYALKNDSISLSVRTQNASQTIYRLQEIHEMYLSGVYDELFDEFSRALSDLLRGFWANKYVLQEFGIRRSNTILLKHLLDERNEHSAYIKNVLRERLFCNLEIFLEYFQNMQISIEGNIEGILEVAGHKTNIAVVFKSFDYLQGNTNVLKGYTLSQLPFQTDNVEFCDDIFNCELVIVIGYDVINIPAALIRAAIADLHTQSIITARDIELAVYRAFGIDESMIDIADVCISYEFAFVIDKFAAIDAFNFQTHTEYLYVLHDLLERNKNSLTEKEHSALFISLIATATTIETIGEFERLNINDSRIRGWWTRWGGCISGAAGIGGGAAVAGFFAGGPKGAFAAGVFGTLYGYAEFCHELLFPPEKGFIRIDEGDSLIVIRVPLVIE